MELAAGDHRGLVAAFEEGTIHRVPIRAYGERAGLFTLQQDLRWCGVQVREIEHLDHFLFRATDERFLWRSREDHIRWLVLRSHTADGRFQREVDDADVIAHVVHHPHLVVGARTYGHGVGADRDGSTVQDIGGAEGVDLQSIVRGVHHQQLASIGRLVHRMHMRRFEVHEVAERYS